MSEFSSGVLTNKTQEEKLRAVLVELEIGDDTALLYPVNEQWIGLLLADEWLMEPDTMELLKTISKSMPLLVLYNAEDHGWGFMIFNNNEKLTAYDCSYEEDEYEDLVVEPTNCDAFKYFGLKQEQCDQIEQIITVKSTDTIDKFKEFLQLTEFSWMSYSYLIDQLEEL